ncbi:hypothetical protein CY0110_15677 [Crocosphaera chwakensis CCY0110]|uniref:Uncharacterized protein n=1 Tax=Crocosphaera chwakensis CCY0110 TaxID=391612 RepID=A3IHG7_9CHRO|nr:hypothetical protein CY0110_15677 [Crocosphaera chwakensis CCY0110]
MVNRNKRYYPGLTLSQPRYVHHADQQFADTEPNQYHYPQPVFSRLWRIA